MDTAMKAGRVAFLSPTGWGNLGDAAIIDSLIHAIRLRRPGAEVVGFTQNPADTRRRHGVEAYTCGAFSTPFYAVAEPEGEGPGGMTTESAPARGAGIRTRLRRLPLPAGLRTWVVAPLRLVRERRHFALSVERLRGCSDLVVAGGGQLDQFWGGALGHPWVLRRWARIAQKANCRFVVASVGTGTLGPVGRRLALEALRQADYRSFRDAASRNLLRASLLTAGDPVVPDLAYGLPLPSEPCRGQGGRVFGLSPLDYRHPVLWPNGDVRAYSTHCSVFTALARRLLAAGHGVVLFVTDNDHAVIDDIQAAVSTQAPGAAGRIRYAPCPTVASLFEVLADVDVVVASRLHAVLLSQLARRPVLALAHERKVRTLMSDMAQDRWCFDIESASPEDVFARLQQLTREREAVVDQADLYVRSCREAVERQYDLLFGPAQDR